MRNLLINMILVFCVSPIMAQKDIIMKRDGSELQVRIIQMNSKYVVYNLESKHDKEDKQIDNRKIYMIKFQKRGNVFFTEQGDRFDGEGDGKVPKGSTVVYLKEGKEILVYDLSMDTNKISYKLSKKKKDSFKYTPKYQVFMIVYPDGTKDIISEFERPKEVQQKVQGPQVKPREEDKSQFVSRSEPTFNSGEAVILTEKNFVIKAVVTQEDENTISFYRKGFTKGPLYHIGKQHVKRIDYIKTNNKSKKRRK